MGGISGESGSGPGGAGGGGPGGFTGSGVGAGTSPGQAMPVQENVDGAYNVALARRGTRISESRISKTRLMSMMSSRTPDQCAVVVAGAGEEALDAGDGADMELGGGVGFGWVCAGVLGGGDGGVVADEAGEEAPGCMLSSLLWQPPAASRTMERAVVA